MIGALYLEGGLYGVKEEYPIYLRVGASPDSVTIKSDEQLYEALEKVLEDPTLRKIKLSTKCEMIGLENTMQLFDTRTLHLFEEYLLWIDNPTKHPFMKYRIWQDAVKLLNGIFKVQRF